MRFSFFYLTKAARAGALLFLGLFLLSGCSQADDAGGEEPAADAVDIWATPQDSTHRIAVVEGFMGPEAVRFDPAQDVFFVGNFNGGGGDLDGNGFISRMDPDGNVTDMQFMVGTEDSPMHAPRGMYISDGTLWVADAEGLHAFDTESGAHQDFVDFSGIEHGFLNDVAVGPDGSVYVTDTGMSRIYRARDGEVSIALESDELSSPNGITWDTTGNRFIVVPYRGQNRQLFGWTPGSDMLEVVGESMDGAAYDGVEFLGADLLVASQEDSSLQLFQNGSGRAVVYTPGRPADIGLDNQRRRVAVPYIALNRVDIWDLPGN